MSFTISVPGHAPITIGDYQTVTIELSDGSELRLRDGQTNLGPTLRVSDPGAFNTQMVITGHSSNVVDIGLISPST